MDEQKWFPEMEPPLGEEAVKIIEIATKHLEKGWRSLRGLTPVLEEVLLWLKCY